MKWLVMNLSSTKTLVDAAAYSGCVGTLDKEKSHGGEVAEACLKWGALA